ncbi:hypothetical protein GHI93_02305 [Lactococcus hircilactis]|uniref:DUF3592 domain-containing protein n=1 Tax=Lactococcus hircilactis TaxID=1494462 RepID=A0A7X2D0T2_9LACT|nr:hypothetical protein [Lactococcus hircilactis]MQW38782.1 hypothetical protein [Lactococcus hircilactis]
MKKIVPIIERIIRIVMLVVAAALLASSISFIGIHMANKNLEKTKTSAVIIEGDDLRAIHEVSFEWKGQTIRRRPLDVYFSKLGDAGEKIDVYVVNKYPDRVFLDQDGHGLIRTAELMGGWGLLLLIILLGERQLLNRINRLEKLDRNK